MGEVRSGEKIRNALEEGMEEILLFKELATLRLDVPITSSINDLVPKEVNQIELNEFCSDLGFENFKY